VIGAQEYVFELHHPRVGKQQRLIAAGDKRGGWNESMAVLDEKVDEILPDFGSGEYLRGHSNSNDRN
jgi:hypothetical protein